MISSESGSAIKGKRQDKMVFKQKQQQQSAIAKIGGAVEYEEAKVEVMPQITPEEASMTRQPPNLCSNCQTSRPKAVTSAYFYFSNQTQVKMKSEALKAGSSFSVTEAAKRCGALWATLSEQEKWQYNKLQQEDTERFNQQKQDLAKNGFFIMLDGRRSCDVATKKPNNVVVKQVPAAPIKAVRTRDRGTQTGSTTTRRKRANSAQQQTMSDEYSPEMTSPSPVKKPRTLKRKPDQESPISQQQQEMAVAQKLIKASKKTRKAIEEQYQPQQEQEQFQQQQQQQQMQFGSAVSKKSPSKKRQPASSANSAVMGSAKKLNKNVSFAGH